MRVIPLQSGSKGNSFYVASSTTSILIDAGISARQANLRLQSHGRDIHDAEALFLTHDHSDHCRFVADYQRLFDLPVHMTGKTWAALQRHPKNGRLKNVRCFSASESQVVGNLTIHSLPTPHDAVDGVAFVIEDEQHRVGILTDLGHAFEGLKEVLQSLDAVVIESNYDDTMLQQSPYPEFLKRRIRGDGGHLSNMDSARLLNRYGSGRLQWICLCHLSGENNCPDTARRVHQQWLGDDCPLFVASRDSVSHAMDLRHSGSTDADLMKRP